MSALGALKDHLMTAIATSAVLGGGTVVITTRVDLARHDERITRIENLSDEMDGLSKELAVTREQLAVVKAKQE